MFRLQRHRIINTLALLLTAVMAMSSAAADDSVRCRDRLVSVGDLKLQVLRACGQPDYREDRFVGLRGPFSQIEAWTYDLGPNQFIRVFEFSAGRLQSISFDGYGFATGAQPQCQPSALTTGMSAYRLQRSCGPPDSIDVLEVLAPPRPLLRPPAAQTYSVIATHRERWVYNFGPRHLLRIITLENGRVTDIELGDRGF